MTLRRARRISFRARLGTFTALAVGITVALASLISYFTVRHQLFSQIDSQLSQEASASTQSFTGSNGVFNPAVAGTFLRRNNEDLLQVISVEQSSGTQSALATATYWSTSRQNEPPLPITHQQAEVAAIQSNQHEQTLSTITYQGSPYRVITIGGFSDSNGDPAALQIARPLSDIDHTLSDMGLILLVVTLSGIAVSVGIGYLIGKATMRPVVRLTAAAEHVAATQNLDAAIEDEGDDELSRLAHAFNSMLSALALSRHQQAQLISDAGHELRTPLTSLRTNIEVLMRVKHLPATDRAELSADVHAQLEELTTLVGDVVDLAQADERQKVDPMEVRLDVIVERAVERARRRAPAVVFDTHLTPGSIRAQPALLERAVLNILDNAAKWSPEGGTVSVWLQRGACWTLDVRDEGPGINNDDLPYVFDRFYRAPAARSMPGSGLGLAIVRQVMTAHGGTVTASTPPEGGTLVHIELPTVIEQEPVAPSLPQAD
jgi:two-component system sensor histidine kinase MprB